MSNLPKLPGQPELPDPPESKDDLHWLGGGGEMADLIRSLDWSRTSLGAIETWPQSLRTTVSLCLASNFPINILWGPEAIQIYNDGYRTVCGGAHPRAMGESYNVTWASAWPAIGKPFERARQGQTSYLENQRMFLHRNGYLEETFFTFSLSPIRDQQGGIAGLFHPVTETSAFMLSARRTQALRDISNSASGAHSVRDAFRWVMDTLEDYGFDLPVVLSYLTETSGVNELIGHLGFPEPNQDLQEKLKDSELWQAATSRISDATPELIENFRQIIGDVPCGDYPEFIEKAYLIPIRTSGVNQSLGFLIVGVSTRLPFDEAYKNFFMMLGKSVNAVLADARAYEEEKRRGEALAEIDRAKTTFFNNVSHEFRTPLTLMLGPLEDLLEGGKGVLAEAVHVEIEVVHRNALRLLKLVNALLDFSRLEANRMKASFVSTDLVSLTQDLVSSFRSAINRAGMKLIVDTGPLIDEVYVDVDMWEKIILNLVSNAFKYTLAGEISVSLKQRDQEVILQVKDTGSGIPQEELDRVFERFHRIQGAQGRTYEGTGIGLSLVRELVKLHGGRVFVESVLGQGSTFFVVLPVGKSHLPPNQMISRGESASRVSNRSATFVEEALRWLPDSDPTSEVKMDRESVPLGSDIHLTAPVPLAVKNKKKIVLADDNRDMRDYVRKLLENTYEVMAVNQGKRAWEAIQAWNPDLLLTDIMMPIMNGIELLQTVRSDPKFKILPVILLSARAGEEAKAEGIELGADDYLTKPFSSKELRARVQTQLAMAEIRKQSMEQSVVLAHLTQQQKWFESVLDLIPTPVLLLELETGKLKFANHNALQIARGQLPLDSPIISVDADQSMHDLQHTAESAAKGQKIKDAEIIWQSPGGTFSFLIDSELVPALPEQPPRVILCLRNITRLKEIQGELKQSIGSRDAFLSLASHELKTPLTVIRLQSQMMRKRLAKGDPTEISVEQVNKMLELTDRQVTRLTSLVNDMLDISLIETGKLTLHPEVIDLSDLVRDVVDRIAPQLELAKTKVHVQNLPRAIGSWDRFRIEQVLINLLMNAARYGEGNPVQVGLDLEGRHARVWVCDQGKGIAKVDQERIFSRFERACSPNEVTGLGLGLYIARQIVERHDGTMQVESEYGRGATFIVRLPLNE